MSRSCIVLQGLVTSLLVVASVVPVAGIAQERVVPDTYLAVTTNMQPAEAELKADVIRWSSDDERMAVIDALRAEDPAAALKELPTMGVIWRNNSAVGNSIKYSHREAMPGGGERVTLVTEKRIGYTNFSPWTADDPADDVSADYTVVELVLDGTDSGQGTMSLAADVSIDGGSGRVSLDSGGREPLLTAVRLAPKPYWATAD